MTLYELVRKYGTGSKGEKKMWDSVKAISEHLERMEEKSREDYWNMLNDVYCIMSDGHYDKFFADYEVSRFYFVSDDGKKHFAPYWNEEAIETIYSKIKSKIPSEYTMYDFLVTMNMMKADNFCMIGKWFIEEPSIDIDAMIVDMSVNYLNDPDAKHPTSKIWHYLH